jgi:hypothetical protein
MLNFIDINIWYIDVHFSDKYGNKLTHYTLNETQIILLNVALMPS